MSDTAADLAAPRRDIDRWLDSYDADHRHRANVAIHRVCVPLILWTVIAFLWLIPVPAAFGRAGLWAALAAVPVFAFYLRLSRPLAFAMLLVFVVFGVVTEGLYRALGAGGLLWTAVAIFVGAWIGQFIGHGIEGRKPSFFTDLAYLLIGPAWVMVKLLRRFGIDLRGN